MPLTGWFIDPPNESLQATGARYQSPDVGRVGGGRGGA
jgi:hypothetical protein